MSSDDLTRNMANADEADKETQPTTQLLGELLQYQPLCQGMGYPQAYGR
jgi:hypothetical protein